MENDDLNNKKSVWPLVGNAHITSFLEKSIINGKVSGAYIFLGPANLGKITTASFFAKSLLCQEKEIGKFSPPCGVCLSCKQMKGRKSDNDNNEDNCLEFLHGDFHLLRKENDKKNISIEQVREFIKTLSMSSFLGSYKIGIIKQADTLSIEAANALLKTLEEPRDKVVVILSVSSLDTIPATIVSRSQLLNFYPVKTSIIYDYLVNVLECNRSFAKNISHLCLGRPALAIKFFEDREFYDKYLEEAGSFLNFFKKDVNERLSDISRVIGTGVLGQENVKKVLSILGIWQGVVRDLMLISLNSEHLIQHEVFSEKLKEVNRLVNKDRLLKLNKKIEESRKYLNNNVNPKLVLENIVCNIT